jgi:hypothetical protein
MPTNPKNVSVSAKNVLVIAAFIGLVAQIAGAQSNAAKAGMGAKSMDAGTAATAVGSSGGPDVAGTLKTAAEAVGLARWSGVGGERLPEVDVVSTMEFWGTGTTYGSGQPTKPGETLPAFKTEYHATLGYNPPAMRVEMTRTSSGASAQGGAAPLHTFQVVREKYAWDESEIGAGLVPGKGTATAAMAAANNRLLQLWILPYGVIKAAVAAGDKTKMSTENGNTVLTFPLSGPLANVMVKATLDANNQVSKVETRPDNPALTDLVTETLYSDYADHGEIPTDVKSPGHIVRKQGGRPALDIQIKTLDANNPYLVFPVPPNVKDAAAH